MNTSMVIKIDLENRLDFEIRNYIYGNCSSDFLTEEEKLRAKEVLSEEFDSDEDEELAIGNLVLEFTDNRLSRG
jgi:hypothetical protein